MYRYRQSSNLGSTKDSLKSFERHHRKIGVIQTIKGYTYSSNGILKNGVLIKGSKGSMRLNSLSWGYSGEGPRGLLKVLMYLQVPESQINRVLDSKWHAYNGVEQCWVINMP